MTFDRRGSGVLLALAGPGLVAVGMVVKMAYDDVAWWVTALVGAFFAAFFAAGVTMIMRAGTTIDGAGVVIRSSFRTRRYSWAGVQEVLVEANPVAGLPRQAARVAVLYDASGARVELPWCNDLVRADLDADVASLRVIWLARRGDDWRPAPAAAGAVAAAWSGRAWSGVAIAMDALLAAMAVFLVGVVISVVLLVAGAYGDDSFADRWLPPVVVLAVLPGLAYVGWVVAALARRGR
ncbi:hypothetical protein ABFU82_12010 [Nocardioides sp. WV_118_6]